MAFIRMRRRDVEEVLENINTLETLIDGKAGSTREYPFYLHDELREASPNIELIENLCEAIPERAAITNQEGSLALHIACYNGFILEHGIEVIKLLMDVYPDSIKSKNNYGMLPLHKALSVVNRVEQLPTIEYLLSAYPEGLTSAGLDGVTPFCMLITQSKAPSLEVIQYFVRKNPEILKLPDAYGQLPLHKAVILPAKRMTAEILATMIEAFPFSASWKDSRGMLPVHWMVSRHSNPDIDMLMTLVEAYPEGMLETDYESLTPLMRFKRLPEYNRDVEEVLLTYLEIARDGIAERKALIAASSSKPSTASSGKRSNINSRAASRKRTTSPTKRITFG